MAIIKNKWLDIEAKRPKMNEHADIINKNMNIDQMRRKYRAIIAKNDQKAVKTPISSDYEAKMVDFWSEEPQKAAKKPTVSETDPNAAFKKKKDSPSDTTTAKIDSILARLEKEEEEDDMWKYWDN